MCPEIFLYSSLLFALSTNSLIRFGNMDRRGERRGTSKLSFLQMNCQEGFFLLVCRFAYGPSTNGHRIQQVLLLHSCERLWYNITNKGG